MRKAIEMLSPHGFSFKGSHILVKPNLCSPFPPEDLPSNTHPDVIGALIRYLREEGATKIYGGRYPRVGTSIGNCLRKIRD